MERHKQSTRNADRTHHENHARHGHGAQLEGQRGRAPLLEKSKKEKGRFRDE